MLGYTWSISMSIETESLKNAKQALKAMSARGKSRLTRQEFVSSLIHEIHAKMQAGFKLGEICEELNKTLPDGAQMKETTFRAYVRAARAEAGIKPIKKWTRRTEKKLERDSHASNDAHSKGDGKADDRPPARTSTEADYRDGDNL